MSAKLYADVVAVVTSKTGYKKYVKVGVMLQMDNNDDKKGPGFMVMLDRYFNPAGVGTDDSVALSTYWPKEKEPAKPSTSRSSSPSDDDFPF